MPSLDLSIPVLAIGGSFWIVAAAVALGFRHGIDWDHIAAITDITSTTAAIPQEEAWLVGEPGLMLTDESHHGIAHVHPEAEAATTERRWVPGGAITIGPQVRNRPHVHGADDRALDSTSLSPNGHLDAVGSFVHRQRPALLLGTMYALGHGGVVFVLGLAAILAREFLPGWIDPIMEKVVGVTLLFLAVYLFYSLYRFIRGGEEFHLRSRWMLVFAAVRNLVEAVRSRILKRPHRHVHAAQQYGTRTAFGIGMIHGIGAETGTQVLVITTAVGAENQVAGIIALVGFLLGLLVSNSVITVISTVGFVSSSRRQWIYAGAGFVAAVFSLIVGLVFLFNGADILPNLDPFA
ncbi:MAG TPA: hypothetical protein VLS25_01045 [Dehalococcoidia bacterium]|nr:hypothetical protein [Dehalococcoidia bacterium]